MRPVNTSIQRVAITRAPRTISSVHTQSGTATMEFSESSGSKFNFEPYMFMDQKIQLLSYAREFMLTLLHAAEIYCRNMNLY